MSTATETKCQIEGKVDNVLPLETKCVTLPGSAKTHMPMNNENNYPYASMRRSDFKIEVGPLDINNTTWAFQDVNQTVGFYDFKTNARINMHGLCFKYMMTLNGKMLMSDDQRTFYSFPECKQEFVLPSKIKSCHYGPRHKEWTIIGVGETSNFGQTVFMNDKYQIITIVDGELINDEHDRILVFNTKNGVEFVDTITFKKIYQTTHECYTSRWKSSVLSVLLSRVISRIIMQSLPETKNL